MDGEVDIFLEKINIALKLSNDNKIHDLKNRYLLATGHFYMEEADDEEFQRVVIQEGFANELDTIVSRIQTNREDMMNEYNNLKIKFIPERIEYGYCCRKQMTVNDEEYVCSVCSRCSPYYEYNKSRKPKILFDHMSYFHKWMSWIEGVESKEINEKLLNEIRSNYYNEIGTISNIRDALKKMKRTDLNKNASLILEKLTGIKPPRIPIDLYQKIRYIFLKIFKQKELGTRIYYPFYIYQIIDKILPENDPKRGILEFIPMQSNTTWNKNLKKWKKIYPSIEYLFER